MRMHKPWPRFPHPSNFPQDLLKKPLVDIIRAIWYLYAYRGSHFEKSALTGILQTTLFEWVSIPRMADCKTNIGRKVSIGGLCIRDDTQIDYTKKKWSMHKTVFNVSHFIFYFIRTDSYWYIQIIIHVKHWLNCTLNYIFSIYIQYSYQCNSLCKCISFIAHSVYDGIWPHSECYEKDA